MDLLRQEWAKGAEPLAARERALRAAAESGRAYDEGVGFSGGVVVAQVRTTVTDLLRATGIEHAEAHPAGAPGGRLARAPAYRPEDAGRTRPGA